MSNIISLERDVESLLNSRISVLTNPYLNRGTAFTHEQRKLLGITGQLPPVVETLEQQVERVWLQLKRYDNPLDRYIHLSGVQAQNATLFYALLMAHINEILPIVYTPTVGEACQKFSNIFLHNHGVFLSRLCKGQFRETMRKIYPGDVKIIVITDGSRILGLGDLGCNGVGISIGKSSLYVAGAGLEPNQVMPVVLDVGTNTDKIRENPFYFGIKEKRCGDAEFYGLLDEFMEAVTKQWPGAVVQFEDFSNNHCFDVLSRYQEKYRCFNDDIQGTGAVIAAGFLNAVKLSKVSPKDHRIIFFGAGSAATGVAQCIAMVAARLYNLDYEELKSSFYFLDSKGLVTNTRGDKLDTHKVSWARKDISAEDSQKLKTLEDVVNRVKPTALIGLGGVPSVFTEGIIKFMATYCERPIIFPLSNPTSQAEVTPDEAYRWTNGKAIIASGSPFPETVLDGKTLKPSQGNNLYVFPGIGLGCALCNPRYIPDDLLIAAAVSLNAMTSEENISKGCLYPPLDDIRDISAQIATDVILEAQRLGIDGNTTLPRERKALLLEVKKNQWSPVYPDQLSIC